MKGYPLGWLAVPLVLLGLALSSWSAEYVGSDTCFQCHAKEYNDFKVSAHPYKIQRAEDAKKWPLPLPKGYSWDDISYVIGGVTKKARYMDKKGYIITITAAKDGSELKTQYNLETDTWAFYHKGERKRYDCGRCHTTGYKKEGHQDGLEGIVGTWVFPGIQCERCHGPGSEHVKSGDKSKITVNSSSAFCGQCHSRGSKDKIPAKGGFIRHHEQYNELLASPHKAFACVTCHDPHKKAKFNIKKSCETCHRAQAANYRGNPMQTVGVSCIECHMPKATKSAVKKGRYEGDIRTHLFRINVDPKANMFYTEKMAGKEATFAKRFVTLGFACLSCHKNRDLDWAGSKVKTIHRRRGK